MDNLKGVKHKNNKLHTGSVRIWHFNKMLLKAISLVVIGAFLFTPLEKAALLDNLSNGAKLVRHNASSYGGRNNSLRPLATKQSPKKVELEKELGDKSSTDSASMHLKNGLNGKLIITHCPLCGSAGKEELFIVAPIIISKHVPKDSMGVSGHGFRAD